MKTVIMAGGQGKRISELFPNIPKPLIPIEGVPVLERELLSLRDQGFTDIILTVGYMSEKIIDYFGDGSKIGTHIEYYIEKEPLGNAGALFKLNLREDFLLLNADSIFDIDFNRFVKFHMEKGGVATILTHPNSHPYDSGLIIADENHTVISWLTKEEKRPQWYRNRVNAGIHVINPIALEHKKIEGKIDLDRQILKPLSGTGKMYCYDSPEYVKDMGTPERFYQVVEDYKKRIIQEKNLSKKQRAIFLDRDGTINKYVGFLRNIDDFELLPGVAEAIREINASGYLTIIITNQPVIARGEVTWSQLEEIHNKLETLLGQNGAYVDAIYVCPHHPDKGFSGEIPELKIECNCRKPKPGLFFRAARDFNIDLQNSWMIGDTQTDIQAGKNAGCKTALIGSQEYGQDLTVSDLQEFIENWKKK